MKKTMKKLFVLAFSLVLLLSTSITTYAASICPPHVTYPDIGGLVGTNTTSNTHDYTYEYRNTITGAIELKSAKCQSYIITKTYLIKYICSSCGIVTGSGTTSYNEEVHPSCGK
ncbi:hypothetical protein [Clostridium sp. Marseille-P299]|uniref:hypothetical protein n=1 Tax=Clostridium sp. Marseille-P299 TaxID=1805477 RepID=UPI0008295CF4|nr:hypothetical protein [Clostridium sp. Marseille-P299]